MTEVEDAQKYAIKNIVDDEFIIFNLTKGFHNYLQLTRERS